MNHPAVDNCVRLATEKQALEGKVHALEKENQEPKREILELRENIRHRF